MNRFVFQSNLPIDADTVLLGEKYAPILKNSLQELHLNPIFVPDNPCVDSRLSGHVDLSVFYAGEGSLFCASYLENSQFSEKISEYTNNCCYLPLIQGEKYPNDAQFNACAIGDRLIYSSSVTAEAIVEFFTNAYAPDKIIDSRQGYAKCSVCVVDCESVITSDAGIASALISHGFDVLKITPGFIGLDGFAYGFIGGSSFKAASNIMAFTGHLDAHPDKERIFDYLKKRSISVVYLTDRAIFDVGSILPITEK